MAESTEYVLLAGAETSEKTEFQTMEQGSSITATNPKTGTYAFLLDYTYINNNSGTDIACQMLWSPLRAFKNFSVFFQLRLEGTPGQDVTIFKGGNVTLRVTTARKLRLGATTGTTVLSTGQYYEVEVLNDIGGNKTYLRIDGVDELNITGDSNVKTTASFGESRKPATGTDPAVTLRIDDIAFWYSASGTDTTPKWWNTTTIDYRTYDAAGTYNDYTGTGDTTNKYNNIDDYAPSDGNTTYNQGGVAHATKRQTHNPVNKTVAATIKGFCVMTLVRDDFDTTNYDSADTVLLVRDNSVDYEWTLSEASAFKTRHLGYEKRPDGTALTNAALNDIEAGSKIFQDNITLTIDPFTALSNTYIDVLPTSDSSSEDGLWTQVGGTGGSAWTAVDDYLGADYIHHNVTGEKQGFGVGTPTTTNGKIVGVAFQTLSQITNSTGTNQFRCYYKENGNFHYTPTVTHDGTYDSIDFGTWSTNPETSANWTASEIGSNEFGIEIVTLNGDNFRLNGFHVVVLVRSDIRVTSQWMMTATGDAYEEIAVADTYVSSYIGQSGYF